MTSFKEYLQEQGKSKSTVNHYQRYVLDFISYLDKDNTEPEAATAKEVLAYLNYLQQKGLENNTRKTRLNVIKQYFNWQLEKGVRIDNPVTHLKIRGGKRQKLYPILSRQELESLYLNYRMPKEDDPRQNRNWWQKYELTRKRNKVILSLMINQGLTTAEVNNLSVKDLHLEQGKLYVAGSRKSAERELELKSHQMMELMQWHFKTRQELLTLIQTGVNIMLSKVKEPGQVRQENGSYQTQALFPSAGVGKTQISLWKRLSDELREHHPRFINFNQVRTSVITHWLKQYNLRQVQYMAGHKYVSSTERYLVNQTEDLQKDVNQFHPF